LASLFSALFGLSASKPQSTANTQSLVYRGVMHSLSAMTKAVKGPRGATSPLVRLTAERVVERIAAKDYLSEVLAVRYWCNSKLPYLRDPMNVEWMRDPQGLIEEMARAAVYAGAPPPRNIFDVAALAALHPRGVARCDCDEFAMLVAALGLNLGAKAEFVTVGFGQRPEPHSHVFTCLAPKGDGLWVACDPVAGTKEAFMLSNAASYDTHDLS